MTNRIHIDWETRSACDLKRAGVYAYAEHPSTDILCAGIRPEIDGVVGDRILCTLGDPMPPVIATAVAEGWEFWAHNAQFERIIWRGVATRKYGWPEPALEQWVCTAAAAAAMALPRDLAGAAMALGLQAQKDMVGHRLMLQVSQPRVENRDGTYLWWDDSVRLQRLYAYCLQDVDVEIAAGAKMRALPASERRVWVLDQKINERGVLIDLEGVAAAEFAVRRATDGYNTRLQQLTGGAIGSVTANAGFVKWLNVKGVDTDTVAKAAVAGFLARADLPYDVREVLKIRVEGSKTSTAKLKQFRERVSADGRMRDNLMYHGAATGRWSGRGAQLQNLPRTDIHNVDAVIRMLKNRQIDAIEELYGPVLSVVSKCLRAFVVAPRGKKFISSDSSAIEARVTAWVCGQRDLLEAFRRNEKIYEKMAASIFRREISAIAKNSVERQIGKAAVLGCGFQMGKDRFLLELEKLQLPADWDLPELAEKSVAAYRADNHHIATFWNTINDAAINAVLEGRGKRFSAGPVSFFMQGGVLWCRLPSGRLLSYVRPSVQMKKTPWGEMRQALHYWGVDTLTKKWCLQDTYGGALTENVVQAIARDVLVEGMFRMEENGLPIVLTVHDETVSEVPEGVSSPKEVDEMLSVSPVWASDLPLKAEGWEGDRYRK